MRFARVDTPDGTVVGEVRDGAVVADSGTYTIGDTATLLPPCEPSTLYCAGRNFEDYLRHKGNERPEQPHFFLKPPAAVWPAEREIPYPTFAEGVGYAGELAAVIDRDCRNVDPAKVDDVVRGYTILNDLDAIGQPGSAMKVFDASAPLGPWIETAVDPSSLEMKTTVGDEVRQTGNTDEMLFEPARIVSFLSERVRLQAGDVIAFGSPANPGEVPPGTAVEIWYEGIGTLRNTVGHPE